MTAHRDFEAFTCECRLAVSNAEALEPALAHVREVLDAVDAACSRFRDDSELSQLERSGGGEASPLLTALVRVALDVAQRSGGTVVPTLGRELAGLGYGPALALPLAADDGGASFGGARTGISGTEGMRPDDGGASFGGGFSVSQRVLPAESWRRVRLEGSVLTVPAGVVLDLGASAKAFAADLCARQVSERWDTSVLVSLGGDIATSGPEAWEVCVQDLCDDPATQVRLVGGWAMATSSTQKRRWRSGSMEFHHILDPWTSLPAAPVWRSVSVAAPDCVSANMASTSAVVRGEGALEWLRGLGFPARLVRHDGGVLELNGWPAEERV